MASAESQELVVAPSPAWSIFLRVLLGLLCVALLLNQVPSMASDAMGFGDPAGSLGKSDRQVSLGIMVTGPLFLVAEAVAYARYRRLSWWARRLLGAAVGVGAIGTGLAVAIWRFVAERPVTLIHHDESGLGAAGNLFGGIVLEVLLVVPVSVLAASAFTFWSWRRQRFPPRLSEAGTLLLSIVLLPALLFSAPWLAQCVRAPSDLRLADAISRGRVATVREGLRREVPIERRNDAPLIMACDDSGEESVALLIDHNRDTALKTSVLADDPIIFGMKVMVISSRAPRTGAVSASPWRSAPFRRG